jgi:hypothetical protein
MDTSLDLPCLAPVAPAFDAAPSVNPVPHEDVEEGAYTLIVPTDAGPITMDVVILNRCRMMATKEYYGPGWRRIEQGVLSIAVRAIPPGEAPVISSDSAARTSPEGPDPSA